MQPSRRTFLATAASVAVLGANDRLRIAVIGAGGRGKYLMRQLQKAGGIEIVAVCDIYDVRRAEAAAIAGPGAEQYLDYKQVLDRKDVDAVIIATPDHWHSQMTVDACKAGKDVYVEKPMVHTPAAGQAIVEAARESNRIVQVGTNARGVAHFLEAKRKYIDSGIIGKVGLVRCWYNSNQGYIQTAPAGMDRKPDGLDWERWTGPGPKIPWNPEVYFSPYKWLQYDGGMIMGIAIHVLDTAHHFLGLRKPAAAVAGGGNYFYEDGRDTPDVCGFILDYPEKVTLMFEAECLTAPGVRTSASTVFRGSGGVLRVERYFKELGYQFEPNGRYSSAPAETAPGLPMDAEGLLRNWIESIQSRRKPVSSEVDGYYSAVACFMGALAYRMHTRITWDPAWDLPA